MLIHASGVEMLSNPMVVTSVHSPPMRLASSTFSPMPKMNSFIPETAPFRETVRD